VDLQLDDVRRRLADRRLQLDTSEQARELIAREGYDPVYGARPLKRFIQREVETRIGRALLSGEIQDGATITVDVADDELVVHWHNPAAEAGAEEEAPTEPEPVGAAAG
jgi:ATP-dependent Clp protease ATP-binding subunit ClpB